MRIRLVAVGRMKKGPESELFETYLKRARGAGHAVGFSHFDIIELAESRAATPEQRKADEAQRILEKVNPDDFLLVLDERGKEMDSRSLAALFEKEAQGGRGGLSVVIGGPDGLDESLRAKANLALSFGRMTWPHQMVRIMLSEQLYRIITIVSGHPYHRD